MNIIMKVVVFIIRKNEFQADKFSAQNGHKEGLIKGLVTIHKENKSNLNFN